MQSSSRSGVVVQPPAAVRAQLVYAVAVVSPEGVDVGGPALGVPDAVYAQCEAVETHGPEESPSQIYDLGVDRRVFVAEHLDAELVMLTVPSGLWALVAEHRAYVEEAYRLWAVAHAVLEVSAADRRGALGPQGDEVAAAVLERVRLLLDDVGDLADSADEQAGVFEDGGVDPLVPKPRRDVARLGVDVPPERLLFGKDIDRPSRRLKEQMGPP